MVVHPPRNTFFDISPLITHLSELDMYISMSNNSLSSQDQSEIKEITDTSCFSPICTDNSPYIDPV